MMSNVINITVKTDTCCICNEPIDVDNTTTVFVGFSKKHCCPVYQSAHYECAMKYLTPLTKLYKEQVYNDVLANRIKEILKRGEVNGKE